MELAALLTLCVGVLSLEHYSTTYDSVDLSQILGNPRLYSKYLACLKGGNCTPDGKQLREIIPEALRNDCERCSQEQKTGATRVLRFLIEKRPEDFLALEKIYDPETRYRQRYQEEANRLGIRLPAPLPH